MRKNTQHGYSLIELVVYIALFAAISVVIIKSLVTSMTTYATAQGYRRLQTNGGLVMERIVREVREASSIGGSSSFNSNDGTLSLIGTGDSGNYTAVISKDQSKIEVSRNGTSDLTTNEVVVNSLVFRRIITEEGEGVKVELSLTTANGYIVSAKFYDTVMLRGI